MQRELEEAKNRGFWDMVGDGLKSACKAVGKTAINIVAGAAAAPVKKLFGKLFD